MSSSIAEQLKVLPLLSTVVRVDFDLVDSDASFLSVSSLIEAWADYKSKAFDVEVNWQERYKSLHSPDMSLEFAKTENDFALLLSHRDSPQIGRRSDRDPHPDDRHWITEISVNRNSGSSRTRFSTRLSIRQNRDSPSPLPRAPRYIGELVRKVGAIDSEILEPDGRYIDSDNLEYLDRVLTSKRRALPVLAISEDQYSHSTSADPAELASYLAGVAHVVVLDGQAAAWHLTKTYGQERSTFNGAVRCYMPGFSAGDDPYKHKRWLRDGIRRIDAVNANGFLNTCIKHIFAAATAQFEQYPLLTPSALRRQGQERAAPSSMPAAIVSVTVKPIEVLLVEEVDKMLGDPLSTTAPAEEPAEETQATFQDASYVKGSNNLQQEVDRLEDLLREARDETAQKNRELTNLQPLVQEVEDLRDELKLLRGEYEVKDAPVLQNFWEGFNLFFDYSKNLVSQFERMQRQVQEDERIKEQRDSYKEEIADLQGKMYHKDRQIDSLSEVQKNTKLPLYPKSWDKLMIAEAQRMEWLVFSATISEDLQHVSFDDGLAQEIDDLLEVLNSLCSETQADGSLSDVGRLAYQEYFLKTNAWFSDESDTNKRKFKTKLTFPDPENPACSLFCPWHGKINQQVFRIHFEWPRPQGQRKIKITYIGSKITKQ